MSGVQGKTILLTGGGGFLGTHLLRRLRAEGTNRLVLLSRSPALETQAGEVRVESSLEHLTSKTWRAAGVEAIDLVLHLGAFTPKRGDEANRVEAVYRDNLEGTRRLLESLPAVPERLVFASTLDVYAPTALTGVLTETSQVAPSSLYGASKLFCEQLVRVFARQSGCGYAILRYGHLYGPGEEAYGKLIPQTIRRLQQGEAPVLYGDGSAERDLLYVEDAVEATLRAASSPLSEIEPINIARGESVPIRDIVARLARLTGFSGDIRSLPERPAGPSFRFDIRRMREVLGTWNLVPLEEGLRREVEYFATL